MFTNYKAVARTVNAHQAANREARKLDIASTNGAPWLMFAQKWTRIAAGPTTLKE